MVSFYDGPFVFFEASYGWCTGGPDDSRGRVRSAGLQCSSRSGCRRGPAGSDGWQRRHWRQRQRAERRLLERNGRHQRHERRQFDPCHRRSTDAGRVQLCDRRKLLELCSHQDLRHLGLALSLRRVLARQQTLPGRLGPLLRTGQAMSRGLHLEHRLRIRRLRRVQMRPSDLRPRHPPVHRLHLECRLRQRDGMRLDHRALRSALWQLVHLPGGLDVLSEYGLRQSPNRRSQLPLLWQRLPRLERHCAMLERHVQNRQVRQRLREL